MNGQIRTGRPMKLKNRVIERNMTVQSILLNVIEESYRRQDTQKRLFKAVEELRGANADLSGTNYKPIDADECTRLVR